MVTSRPAKTKGELKFVVEMAEVYTGWVEVHNMQGAPGAIVNFQVSTTEGKDEEYNMEDSAASKNGASKRKVKKDRRLKRQGEAAGGRGVPPGGWECTDDGMRAPDDIERVDGPVTERSRDLN